MDTKLFGGKEASEILGVHQRTLYLWEKKGLIETVRNKRGGKRFYNVNKYLEEHGMTCVKKSKNTIKCDNLDTLDDKNKLNICYARVSSHGQTDDLERQKELLHDAHPDAKIIEDIGSGINMTKRGLLKIIDLAISGKINTLVVVHKDRLTRFGYDLIEHIIEKYSNGKIIVMKQETEIEPEEEMVKDVLQIMNVFVAKMNGMRKYRKHYNDSKHI